MVLTMMLLYQNMFVNITIMVMKGILIDIEDGIPTLFTVLIIV